LTRITQTTGRDDGRFSPAVPVSVPLASEKFEPLTVALADIAPEAAEEPLPLGAESAPVV
jgi:hypothetical protein